MTLNTMPPPGRSSADVPIGVMTGGGASAIHAFSITGVSRADHRHIHGRRTPASESSCLRSFEVAA